MLYVFTLKLKTYNYKKLGSASNTNFSFYNFFSFLVLVFHLFVSFLGSKFFDDTTYFEKYDVIQVGILIKN